MAEKQFLGEFEELVLLALLKLRKEDAYGFKIAEAIEEATGKRVSLGALYTTLGRLTDKKFISSSLGEKTEERGGRAKKFFTVESAGKSAIAASDRGRARLRTDFITSVA